jgi:hypothetical protein
MAETLKKIKEIYGWDIDINDDTDFLASVKYRESIYEKYYDSPNLKEDYEKLKKDLDTNIEVRCNLETDVFKLASQIKKLTEEMDELTHDKQELEKIEEIWKEGTTEVKQLKEEIFMWRTMAQQEFGNESTCWTPGEVGVEIEYLKNKIEDLKNQIPKKPRKCFSYNDKKVLESLLDDVECLSQAQDQGSPLCISGGFDAKKKLIERLLK